MAQQSIDPNINQPELQSLDMADSGITERAPLIEVRSENKPMSIGLSDAERMSIICNLPGTNNGASLEEERITFNRLSVIALNNGMGRDDRAADEHSDFFQPETDVEGGKQKLSDFLDDVELSETDLHSNFCYQYDREKSKTSFAGKLLRGAKAIGKFALTAVPKAIDVLLPASLQTTPKLEMIRGLEEQRNNQVYEAERECQMDISAIERRYDAIKSYVNNFYGDLIVPFNIHEPAELSKFMEQCLADENSLHYKNIQRLVETRVAARRQEFEKEKQVILADKTYEENIKDIRESSWLLRSLDKLKAKANEWKETAANFYMSHVGQPALDMSIGYGKTELAMPVPKYSGRRLSQQQPPDNSTPPPSGGSGKWFSRLAAGLALLTAGLVTSDIQRSSARSSGQQDGSAEIARGSSTTEAADKIKIEKRDEKTPVTVAAQNESEKKTAPAEAQRTTSDDTRKVARKAQPVRPHRALRPSLRTSPRYSAKNTMENKPVTPQTVLNPEIVPESNHQGELLSEAAKLTQLRLVEAKVAAYQHRVASIQQDQKRYRNLPETELKIYPKLKLVNPLLDSIKVQMKSLETQEQVDKVNATMAEIDGLLGGAQKVVMAVNVAHASTATVKAKDLLKMTSQLSQDHGQNFTIVHNDQAKNSVTAYSVNLQQINTRLQEIHSQLYSETSQNLSLEESRMLLRDAEYWVGYLNFVNWYLQHNPNQITAQK